MNRNSDVYLAVTSVKKCPLEYKKFQRKLNLTVLEKIKITLTSLYSCVNRRSGSRFCTVITLSLCLISKGS